MLQDPNPPGLCLCGCGRATNIAPKTDKRSGAVKGKPRKYIHGHPRRRATVLAGDRYGLLVVKIEAGVAASGGRVFACMCDCGEETIVPAKALRSGHTQSCGCLTRIVHGMAGTPAWKSWAAMVGRCTNPKNFSWPNYGGRGIAPCGGARWFPSFFAAMGERPDGLSIDRIDNDGGYWCGACAECRSNGWPKNMRWADAKAQANNRRPRRGVVVTPRNAP